MQGVPLDLTELDGDRLGNLLRAGIYRLFTRTDHINKINVFPVPDGDTGTNMSMTLAAVLAALDREPLAHAGALLVRAADAAIDGARGNSGAILAQFLLGLADKLGHLPHLGIKDFAAGVAGGAAYARDALTQPREGTLLTVLRDFGKEIETLSASGTINSFRALFATSMARVRASLDGTRDQLDELRAANVVDAGAQGFVDMLEGMTHYLDTGDLGVTSAPVHSSDESMAIGAASAGNDQRFCTECLITAPEGVPATPGSTIGLDLRHLREGLSTLGASLVVSGNKRKARVHIHTDEPERVFQFAGEFGAVSSQKADDMRMQQAAAHHRNTQRIVVVTDSAADIPDDLIERYGIHLVAVRVHFGNRSYLDKVSLSPEEFYHELATNPEHPKTSQPPPGDFRRIYEFLSSHYDGVVSIALTAKVSGSYNAAATAAQRVAAEGRPVRVIDSGNASLGQGLVVLAAAERAFAGGTVDEVERAARDAIATIWTFGLLATVDYAVRGGRVPKIVKTFADLLRFAPVLASFPDGKVGLGGVIWGRRNLTSRFARFVAARLRKAESAQVRPHPNGPAQSLAAPRYRVHVGHGNAETEGHQLLQLLIAALPPGSVESSHVMPLGTALGVHGGPGMLVVGVQRQAG